MKSFVSARSMYSSCVNCAASICILGMMGTALNAYGQCNNTTLFPTTPVIASAFNDTVLISSNSNAGQYFQVKNLAPGQSYVFIANAGDFITLRNPATNAVLGAGAAPYTYAAGAGIEAVNVHLNLASPTCGTDATPRTTKVVCSNCPSPANKVGINQPNPQANLDVGGEIKLGNAARTPQAGMVRWNPASNDFEGYNGTQWLSLTRTYASNGSWGQISAANIQENLRLTAADGATNDYFGYSVGIDGDYAVIGAWYDDIGANNDQGSAYIFFRNGNSWTQQAKLTASDGAAGDKFGSSVSISGDFVLVGAAYDTVNGNASQGSAYVFLRNGTTWIQQAKLTASDGSPNDQLGYSVSISGDYALAGANYDDVNFGDNRGSAYVFVRSGSSWTQQAKLTASDAASGDNFGTSVSISGNYALIGSPYDDIDFADDDKGSAYLFVRSGTTWGSQLKLTASDKGTEDYFGTSVSISGDYAIIGAPYDDITDTDQGSAYVFVRNGAAWQQQAKLLASDRTAQFGTAVSISGDNLLVGAPYSYENKTGNAYFFARETNTWSLQSRFTPSDRGISFSVSGSLSGNNAIIGAYLKTIGLNVSQGSAYIIRKN